MQIHMPWLFWQNISKYILKVTCMRESNLLSGHGQRTYIQRGNHTQHLRISAVLQKQLSVFYTSQKVYFYPCQHHQQPNSELNHHHHHHPFLKTQAPSHALVRNCKIPHFLLTQKPCGLSAKSEKNKGKNSFHQQRRIPCP